MRRGNNQITVPNDKYYIEDRTLLRRIVTASTEFACFKFQGDLLRLGESIRIYKGAADLSDTLQNIGDSAYCHRKYGTAIIRDKETDHTERYQLAKQQFAIAITKFKQAALSGDSPAIRIELQRALAFQCHVALELKDGDLLEESAAELLQQTNLFFNPSYHLDALIYLYKTAFARSNLAVAQQILDAVFKYMHKIGIEHPTEFRHLAKTNLAAMMLAPNFKSDKDRLFQADVQNVFWKAFDKHKDDLDELRKNAKYMRVNFDRVNNLLQKDFVFLAIMKLAQRVQGIPGGKPNESVCQYLIRQISAVYRSRNGNQPHQANQLKKTLYSWARQVRESKQIKFSSKLFVTTEPPSYKLTDQEIDDHLGDIERLATPKNSSHTT